MPVHSTEMRAPGSRHLAGWIVIAVLWLGAAAAVGVVGFEFWLRRTNEPPTNDLSRLSRLKEAYRPFINQYVHPEYLFFFPLDPVARVALSNEVCHLDADGFRGMGPAHRGARKLAFLLGGSAAFGHLASSDAGTITAYLNEAQERYFFVNAGVPSWNSTQELFRLASQIMGYTPDLVIAYDGANDASIAQYYAGRYPPGTPESFDELASYFEILGDDRRPRVAFGSTLLPALTTWLKKRRDAASQTSSPLPEAALNGAVDKFVENHRRMRDLVVANNGRFVSIFQPVAETHKHVSWEKPGVAWPTRRDFQASLALRDLRPLEYHDFSSLFDRFFEKIPVAEGDVNDETIFVDSVHLFDPGNKLVAREIWRAICPGEADLAGCP